MHPKLAPKDFYLGLLLFVLSIFTPTIRADSLKLVKPSLSVGFQVFTGFIIPHTESVRSISNSNPRGLEANVAWHYSDEKAGGTNISETLAPVALTASSTVLNTGRSRCF